MNEMEQTDKMEQNQTTDTDSALPEQEINQEQKLKEDSFEEQENSEAQSSKKDVSAAEHKALNDKYLRLYAEFENYRRRTARESIELMTNANHTLIGKLTEVLDNFARAFDPKLKSENLADFEKGIRMIHQKFNEILDAEGLEEINPIGQEFDPNLHEALMQQASDEVKENHITTVFEKGYRVKTKVVKHAKVVVSKGSE